MPNKRANSVTPTVHAVLDTNCIHSDAEGKLVNLAFSTMIETTGDELGIDIHWYVPSVVVGERRRQMNAEARKLLPHIERAANLLGRDLIAGPEELSGSIDRAIASDISRLGLKEIELDVDRVAWGEIIKSAVERRLPFEPDKPDKGFKDALILETFKQIISTLPKTSKSARIFLISDDGLLTDAAAQLARDFQNVAVVKRGDLRSRLTAIAVHISQADLESLLPKAAAVFFVGGEDKKGLYYKAAIGDYTRQQLAAVASKAGLSSVKIESLVISTPTFIKKEGQRLSFSSSIKAVGTASKQVLKAAPTVVSPSINSVLYGGGGGSDLETGYPYLSNVVVPSGGAFLSGVVAGPPLHINTSGYDPVAARITPPEIVFPEYQTETYRCESAALIEWIVTLTQANNLTNAQVVSKGFEAGTWKAI